MSEFATLCRECGGKCCKKPFLTDNEYIRLALVIGNDKVQAGRPTRISNGWMFRADRCPGVTDTGCVLPYPDRPLACRIYPFVAMPAINTDLKIEIIPLLAVQTCPHWDIFGKGVEDVKQEIKNAKEARTEKAD